METYLPLASLWQKAKVSRQRLYQIMEHYGIELPEPDAMLGTRKIYKEATVEAFIDALPTRENRKIQILKFKADNPDFMSVQDFIRSKSMRVSDKNGFVVKMINKAKAGEIESITYGKKTRLYKIDQLQAEYDKSYGDKAVGYAMSRIRELLAEHPNAVTKEEFCISAGITFTTLVGRLYQLEPEQRPKPLFRAGHQSFFDKDDLAKLLTKRDLLKVARIELAKASE